MDRRRDRQEQMGTGRGKKGQKVLSQLVSEKTEIKQEKYPAQSETGIRRAKSTEKKHGHIKKDLKKENQEYLGTFVSLLCP